MGLEPWHVYHLLYSIQVKWFHGFIKLIGRYKCLSNVTNISSTLDCFHMSKMDSFKIWNKIPYFNRYLLSSARSPQKLFGKFKWFPIGLVTWDSVIKRYILRGDSIMNTSHLLWVILVTWSTPNFCNRLNLIPSHNGLWFIFFCITIIPVELLLTIQN